MLLRQSYGFSYTETTVLPSDLSYFMVAAMLSGIRTVSFFSPNRYISEALVFSTRASVSALSIILSSFDLKDGPSLYIPSLNLCPLPEEAIWAAVPHDDSMTAAAISSTVLFFMSFSPYYFIIISYLRNLLCFAITVPLKNCFSDKYIQVQYYDKNYKKQNNNGKRGNKEVGQLLTVV